MVNVRILDYSKDKAIFESIAKRQTGNVAEIDEIVRKIIEKVKKKGDNALVDYSWFFDKVIIKEDQLIVSKQEIKEAYSILNDIQISAIKKAIENIRQFAKTQMPKPFSTKIADGIQCSVLFRPIEKIGCYIPAGRYPLPSTTYMTIIPAKVAGVKEIIVATPPKEGGKADPAVIVTADLCGASKIVKVGGAQAIAALAYGTETIPKVDKIVGPGNIYVTAAKRLLYGQVGIDMLAGPSEVLIIASKNANPKFVAADMLAQAEHDPLASAILITDSKKLANTVKKEIISQTQTLSTRQTIEKSFDNFSFILLVENLNEGIEISNEIAPEHLEIVGYDKTSLDKIINAGSIFFGEYSCEAAGDYCSGTNHVLPTGKSAKFRGGLSVYDFLKMITIQELTKEGLFSLKQQISIIADMEGLLAHKNSVLKRFENSEGEKND